MTMTFAADHSLVLPFAVTPRQACAESADLSEFVLAHRALRSGTRLLANAVTAIAAGASCARDRHEAVVWFARHVLHEISEHHRKEDDILWPVIAASVPADLDLAALSDVHGVLDGVLRRTRGALQSFARNSGAGAPALAAALTELADDLDAHIVAEEAALFPVIREFVSTRDLVRCQRGFARHHPRAHRRFMIAWLQSLAHPAERVRVPLLARVRGRRRLDRWLQRRDLVAGA